MSVFEDNLSTTNTTLSSFSLLPPTLAVLGLGALAAGALSLYSYLSYQNPNPPVQWAPLLSQESAKAERDLTQALAMEARRRQSILDKSAVPSCNSGLVPLDEGNTSLSGKSGEELQVAVNSVWNQIAREDGPFMRYLSAMETSEGDAPLELSEMDEKTIATFRKAVYKDISTISDSTRTTYTDLLAAKASQANLSAPPSTSRHSKAAQTVPPKLTEAETSFSHASQQLVAASSFLFASTPGNLSRNLICLGRPGTYETEEATERVVHTDRNGREVDLSYGPMTAAFAHPDAQRFRAPVPLQR